MMADGRQGHDAEPLVLVGFSRVAADEYPVDRGRMIIHGRTELPRRSIAQLLDQGHRGSQRPGRKTGILI